jgi:hypothetical protein
MLCQCKIILIVVFAFLFIDDNCLLSLNAACLLIGDAESTHNACISIPVAGNRGKPGWK